MFHIISNPLLYILYVNMKTNKQCIFCTFSLSDMADKYLKSKEEDFDFLLCGTVLRA